MAKINCFTEGIELPFHGLDISDFEVISDLIFENLSIEKIECTIILTDNQYIQSINKDYRNIDTPTDVISFSNRDEPFPGESLDLEDLGDIYISLPKALQQSEEYNVTFKNEIARLLVHGILHLLGYDHETSDEDAQKMYSKEDDVLQAIIIDAE